MKRALVLSLLMIAFSAVAFAGPQLGVSFVPSAVSAGELTVGWGFGSVTIEASKFSLETYVGEWSIGALWTPQLGTFGYRAGMRLLLDWRQRPDPLDSGLFYKGFDFIVGVSSTWGPVQLYGDLRLNPTGALVVLPVVGINILFADLIPGVTI